ncbi:MAG: hypothetical protein K2P78_13445, partial [Gemmataceae bacterium]|nr:hypothetical protein [Gemmataceae bacterium]
GGADFFDWVPGLFKRKGDQVCTIDGTKIYQSDLDKLRFRRAMANRFMLLAALEAEQNVNEAVSEKFKNVSPQFRNMLPIVMQNPQLIDMLLDDTPNKPKPMGLSLSEDEKAVLRGAQALNAIGQLRQMASITGGYFANAPNRSSRDLVEFLLWEKKAQQMGVRFTEDDVKALIRKEFYGQFKNDVRVRKQMEEMKGFNLDACLKAIGDEFRVRTVQTALLGPMTMTPREDSTLSAPPMFTGPYALYDFYRDKVSPTTYSVIAVPGPSFVLADRVPGTPTEAELRALYDKYADQEYDPAREEPGFRQPRKVKVEWVQAAGAEPYYQKKAQEWVAFADKYRKSELGALAVPLPGVGPGFAGLAVAPVAATDPLIWSAYQSVDYYHKGSIRIDWESSQYVMRTLDTSVVRPQNMAALAGGSAGALLAFGGPVQPLAATYGGAMFFEQGDRVKAGMPLFFALPGPGLEATVLGGAVGTKVGAPRTIPIEAFRPQLVKQVTDDKARQLALEDLRKLKADVAAIGKDTKLGASERVLKARDTVAAFVKERGLQTGATTDFRDEWTIEDDPGMAPLKAAAKPAAGAPGAAAGPVRFGRKFFWTEDFDKLRGNPRAMELLQSGGLPVKPATGRFDPDFYPNEPTKLSETDPAFLFWRTEEQESKKLTYDQAKNSGALAAAWKRVKARELAKARAEAIAARLRRPVTSGVQVLQNVHDEQKVLQDEFRGNDKAADRVKQFDIDNVAPLAPGVQMTQFGGGEKSVHPFKLDASANLPYPTAEFEKALLDHRADPVGTVLVLADKPKDTYYVVTLTRRQVLTPKDFNYEVFAGFAQQGGVGFLQVEGQPLEVLVADLHEPAEHLFQLV